MTVPGNYQARRDVFSCSMRIAIALLAASLYGAGSPALEKTLARTDQNSAPFKSMSSKIRRVAHTAVINEDNVDLGTLRMRRSKKDAQVLVDLTSPDPKTVAVSGAKVEMYYPK